jgi:hypothetical protein
LRLLPLEGAGASSSQGLGGIVGPSFTTGSLTVAAGAIFRAVPPEVEDALTVALKMVAAAKRIVAAAKSFVFAKALDIRVISVK